MAAIAGPILGGIASAAASKLFSGGGPSIPDPSAGIPKNIATPGFTLTQGTIPGTGRTVGGGRFGGLLGNRTVGGKQGLILERTGETSGLLERLGLINTEEAKRLGGLIDQVAPGVGALTDARLEGLNNVRRRTIGDIRENLARRRVLGSSFAQDAITRAEREFAQEEAEIRASSFLQELELTQKLSAQRADLLRSTVLTGLEQSNFEAQLAANFANRVQAVMGSIGQFQAQLAAQAQAGLGAFFQPAVQGIGSAVSQGVKSLFPPSQGGTNLSGGTVFNAPNTASP